MSETTNHQPMRIRMLRRLGWGALLIVSSAWLFGMIAEDVVTGDRLTLLDLRVAEWLHRHVGAGMTGLMLRVSQLHSTVAMTIYSLAIGALACKRRQRRRVTTLALCMGGGLLLNVLLKLTFQRPRPQFADPILTLTSYSFPSGHVAASTIFYGLGVVWVFARTPAVQWRLLAVIGAAMAISLVAFSRMYLGVHYLSDVAAAFAESLVWLSLCLLALAACWPRPAIAPTARER